MTSPGYSFTLPHGWSRLNLAGDLAVEIEMFLDEVTSLNRARDARDTVLARRRARDTCLAICSRARQDGLIDLYVFSSADGPPMGPMCLSVLPVVMSGARTGASSTTGDIARSLARQTSRLSTLSTEQGIVARVLDRWADSPAQWAEKTELALGRLGIAGTTDLPFDQQRASEEQLETARVQYVIDVPGHGGTVLVLTFLATGGPLLSPQLAHADDIVRAFRWTTPSRPTTPPLSAEIRADS